MQKQNVSEYKIIRSEAETIKNCITDYVKFLFLIVGAVISALGISLSKTDLTHISIAYSSISSIVISFLVISMLYILLYKFISHNRYLGYSLLLCQEKWKNEGSEKKGFQDDDLIIWELCLNQLRKFDAIASAVSAKIKTDPKKCQEYYQEYQEYIKNYITKIETDPKKCQEYQEYQEYIEDKNNIEKPKEKVKDFCFLIKSIIFMSPKTSSWEFPTAITRIFLSISCLFFLIGFIGFSILSRSIFVSATTCTGIITSIIAFIILFISLIFQILLGLDIAKKYHSILAEEGYKTISAFRDKFYPIREKILTDHYDIKAEWALIGKSNLFSP